MDKTKSLKILSYLRRSLTEVYSEMEILDAKRAEVASRRIELEQLIEWAEEEAVKEIKKEKKSARV